MNRINLLRFGNYSFNTKHLTQKRYVNKYSRLESKFVGCNEADLRNLALLDRAETRNGFNSTGSCRSYHQLRMHHSRLKRRHATNLVNSTTLSFSSTLKNGSNPTFRFPVHNRLAPPFGFTCNRHISSIVTIWPDSWPIWGGSGHVINFLHDSLGTPYWGTFVALSLGVRFMLIPVVIWGAQASSQFGKALPDIVFLFQLSRNDLKQLNRKGYPLPYRLKVVWDAVASLYMLFRLHKVKPYAIFLSPLLQSPIFYYLSVDMRKICNGSDLTLAQNLVDANVFNWINDLTEPDPWVALPVTCGIILYGNMEIAFGTRNLVAAANNSLGEPVNAEERKKQADSKATQSNTSSVVKDVFQSLAIFMPCITCSMPAGLQIYLTTSFLFTSLQSFALRDDKVRQLIGLPLLSAPKPDIIFGKLLIEEFEAQQKMAVEKANNETSEGSTDTAAIMPTQSDTNLVGVNNGVTKSTKKNDLVQKSNKSRGSKTSFLLSQKRFAKQLPHDKTKQQTNKR